MGKVPRMLSAQVALKEVSFQKGRSSLWNQTFFWYESLFNIDPISAGLGCITTRHLKRLALSEWVKLEPKLKRRLQRLQRNP